MVIQSQREGKEEERKTEEGGTWRVAECETGK